MMRPTHRAVLVAGALLVVLTGCSAPEPQTSSAVPPDAAPAERVAFVALGGEESDDPFSQNDPTRSWAQQVFLTLPTAAVFVDLAERDVSARATVRDQLPRARALRPTLATIWLGSGDLAAGTSPESFTESLTAVVTGLQDVGTTRVLLLARSKPAAPGGDAGVGYGAEVTQVARQTGAVIVALPTPDQRLGQEAIAVAVRRLVPS
jgi:hypothetical protein